MVDFRKPDIKEQKMFNKAFMDLRHLSLLEMFATESRLNKDFPSWRNALEAWVNKLSPDLTQDELKVLDNELSSIRTLIQSRTGDRQHAEMLLNRVERKLYAYEKALNIGNPAKNNDEWFDGEHSTTITKRMREDLKKRAEQKPTEDFVKPDVAPDDPSGLGDFDPNEPLIHNGEEEEEEGIDL